MLAVAKNMTVKPIRQPWRRATSGRAASGGVWRSSARAHAARFVAATLRVADERLPFLHAAYLNAAVTSPRYVLTPAALRCRYHRLSYPAWRGARQTNWKKVKAKTTASKWKNDATWGAIKGGMNGRQTAAKIIAVAGDGGRRQAGRRRHQRGAGHQHGGSNIGVKNRRQRRANQ